MRRALWVELRRGTAPVAALAMFGAGVWVLVVHPDDWGGRWVGLADYLRVTLLVLCPLMVSAGAWQAGRERRRDIGELIAATPRPGWHALVAAWLAVTLAGIVGLVLAFGGAAVLVARVATYDGGDWWQRASVGVLALAAATAGGVLVGRRVRLRVAAPIAGLATYVGLTILTYWNAPPARLSPADTVGSVYSLMPGWVTGLQATWLVALTALLLAVAVRRWRVALLAGAVAIAAAVPINTAPSWYRAPADPAAVELVCTSSGPEVCLTRVNAFLLDEVAAVAQPILARLDGIPGAPRRAVDEAVRPPGDSVPEDADTVWLDLYSQATAFGDLANVDYLRWAFGQRAGGECAKPLHGEEFDQRIYQADDIATDWLLDVPPVGRASAGLRELPPSAQRDWFADYLDAAGRCDLPALVRLAEQP
ncbi:hypothetical protein [Salinispora sp. H7-4]|uniref:hypothetical protein n=1 Tax=Salinispora sp. H7-4 TaxID=2748321 RepID=UPI0015D2338A|nr:hypothetical protein [Salinispora sp. H7-4]NYT95252.1 hypothetical protein [Salinispora sp. H7-4]